jgi:hypothetical protein
MRRFYLIVILFLSPVLLSGEIFKKSYQTPADWDNTLYDWKIDAASVPGAVKMLRTELITDEVGVTTLNMDEVIQGSTWIKKEFLLDQVQAESAVLLIHWNKYDIEAYKKKNGLFWVDVNGHAIRLDVDFDRMLTGGWIRCDVPVWYLRPGVNDVILRNDSDYAFVISVEASRQPNRSAKSLDGGKTWDYDHLGRGGFIDGEYLIRLRLGRYPSRAEILSDYIEVASLCTGQLLKPQVLLKKIDVSVNAETPPGTSLVIALRGGPTPSFSPLTWSYWQPQAELRPEVLRQWKFFQWRVEFMTKDHAVAPSLKGLTLTADLDIGQRPQPCLKVTRDDNQTIIRGYYPYAYQDAADHRLQVLKERFRLGEVVGGCSSEFEEYRTLAFWVRGSWRDGWGKHTDDLHTPWDALISLELTPQYKASGMCTIYGTTYVQTALALGLQARQMILDHHFISEVWSDDFRKWVTFDIGNSTSAICPAFQEKDGQPLNSLEIHTLARAGKEQEIWVVPVGIHDRFRGNEAPAKQVLGPIQWKPRFGIPLRNNFLSTWLPGELEHGFMQYHYDGYLWWKDSPIPRYEEYTFQSSHVRDFYWTLNQAQVFLEATDKPQKLNVRLDTVTPNFKNYEASVDEGEWKSSSESFVWTLHEGRNTLRVRPVNAFERRGIVSTVEIALGH